MSLKSSRLPLEDHARTGQRVRRVAAENRFVPSERRFVAKLLLVAGVR